MKYFTALMLTLLLVFPAEAGSKSNKRGLTKAQYEKIKDSYHRVCDDANEPYVWFVGASTEEVLKWCKAVAKLLYRTGDLGPRVGYRSKGQKSRNRKYYKKKKPAPKKDDRDGICALNNFCN